MHKHPLTFYYLGVFCYIVVLPTMTVCRMEEGRLRYVCSGNNFAELILFSHSEVGSGDRTQVDLLH